MKRATAAFCLLIISLFALSACASSSIPMEENAPEAQTPDAETASRATETQTPDTETASPNVETRPPDDLVTEEPSSQNTGPSDALESKPSGTLLEDNEIHINEDMIDSFFKMTEDEVINALGEYEIIIADDDGLIYTHYFVNTGLSFVFNVEGDLIYWIDVLGDFQIRGAGAGMNFTQIQECLGEALIFPAWFEHPFGYSFFLEYQIGDSWYEFMSYKLDGSDSRLRIKNKSSALRVNNGLPPSPDDYIFIKGVACNKNLTALHLNGIELRDEDIIPLSGMRNLNYLYLANNRITDLKPFSELTELVALWITDNQIEDLTPLSGLVNLTNIYLSGNPISDWSPVEHIPKVWGRP